MAGSVTFLSPNGLHKNPAFSQTVAVVGPMKTVYVGGQNAVDAAGGIVGEKDIAAQSEQVAKNVRIALEANGATTDHVIKWSFFLVQGQAIGPAVGAFQKVWGRPVNPPTISVLFVSALAHPDFLIEVEAVAVVPDA